MDEIKTVKSESCPSLSGRSTLSYSIGIKGDGIYLCLTGNTGSGIFSKDWIALTELDTVLTSDEKPITAGSIKSLFQGKSVNTVGFLIAALIAEGLLKISEGSLRSYQRVDPAEFKKAIQKLIDTPKTVKKIKKEEQ